MTTTSPRPAAAPSGVAASPIRERFLARTPASAQSFARTRLVVAGGNSRQAAYFEPYPLCLERGQGARVWDLDGNEYLDLIGNYTAMVHGHAYPPIVEAVVRQVPRGTGWAANCAAQEDLASQLVERVRAIDRVRFCNSGTEAANLALMLARLATGRQRILMARHGYHGSVAEFESGTMDHPGPHTLLGTYGDLTSFERVFAERGGEVAAVFIEPVMGAGGVLPGSREFLHGLQAAARRAGALFVADEVITFRLDRGGRHQVLGLDPDLVMFGKLIGGGFPVGAVGGKYEIMRRFEPDRLEAFHSGTYNANPITMAAGAVSVRELTTERISAMERLGERLVRGLEAAARRHALAFAARQISSLVAVFLSARTPAAPAERMDQAVMSRFHLAALNHGVLFAPRGMMAINTVIDEPTVDQVIERCAAALADVAAEAPPA